MTYQPAPAAPAAPTAPATALRAALERVESALAAGDTDAANIAMTLAADLCRDLQDRGVTVPAAELAPLRELGERCGSALLRLATALNAQSLRDDNHRRALTTYHASLRR